jgi:hypothetical protein
VSLADPVRPAIAAYRLADGRSTSLRIVIDPAGPGWSMPVDALVPPA